MSNKEYYETNYEIYNKKTYHIDPTSFLEPFTNYLSPPETILDIGCGSGRDMLWFKNRGYNVVGIERSHGLVKLAKQNTKCEVIHADFNNFNFSKINARGIILIGSLVHEPKTQLPFSLQNILKALREHGYLLISMKEGEGKLEKDDGRTFQLWQTNELSSIFKDINLKVLETHKSNSKIKNGDKWISFILQAAGS